MTTKNILKNKGIMIVLSSPSGAGKTSICKKILKINNNIKMSVSVTTRKQRSSELEGKDYYFYTQEKFLEEQKKKMFLESAKVFGNYYATPKKFVEKNLISGNDVIFDIDWQGAQKLSDYSKKDIVSFFILPPTRKELKERLKKRNEDSSEIVKKRMSEAKSEISHWIEYDYVIINKNLDKCVNEILEIIKIEKKKRFRQNSLFDFIDDLLNS